MTRAGLWLPVVLCAVCGCASATPSKAPAAAPATAAPSAESSPGGSPATDLERHEQAAPSPAPPPPTAATQTTGVEGVRASARTEMDRAERELDASTGDCQSACRALASMERATQHLCSLADQDDDRRRCDDARRRLSEARNRVRSACGVYP